MKKLLYLFAFLVVRSDSQNVENSNAPNRIVCFYERWGVYRAGPSRYEPGAIDPFLCTHLIYAFATFSENNTIISLDQHADFDLGGFSIFTNLKKQNTNLKTLLSVGGWEEGSARYSQLVASRDRSQQLSKNIVLYLNEHNFDGLDLHWKYPAFREGGRPEDKENYAQFIREISEEFKRASLDNGKPSVSVPGSAEYLHRGFDIPKINEYVDWYNLLSFDYYDVYNSPANHHSALYSETGDVGSVDYSINFYRQAGADASKIVLGIPTYGRSKTLSSDKDIHFGAPTDGPGEKGPYSDEKGYLAYYEICQNIKNNNWTVVQSNTNLTGPYAYSGNQWVGYDDEAIVERKAQYAVNNGLGGIVIWSLNSDDFQGNCSGQRHTLIKAAKKALEDRLSLLPNYEKTRFEVIESSRPFPSDSSSSTYTLQCTYCKSKYTYNNNPALCCIRSNKPK